MTVHSALTMKPAQPKIHSIKTLPSFWLPNIFLSSWTSPPYPRFLPLPYHFSHQNFWSLSKPFPEFLLQGDIALAPSQSLN